MIKFIKSFTGLNGAMPEIVAQLQNNTESYIISFDTTMYIV